MSDVAVALAERIATLRQQPRRRWLGLMSGTSCDGIDAATVELSWEKSSSDAPLPSAKVIAGETHDFPPKFAEALREVLDRGPTAEDAAVWDTRLGDRFAEAAAAHLARHGAVDAISVSGHTFAHRPDLGATLQVGQPARVRERAALPVVSGFRTADVARGGEGAPLVPAADRVLFGHDDRPVVILNLGGIGNVTWLPDRSSDPSALDTGPANLVLDGLWRDAFPDASERFDRDGRCAARGRVDWERVESWNTHPYFESSRRSTGREEFGAGWVASVAGDTSTLSPEDRLATASAWVASSVARGMKSFADPAEVRVYVGGGGAHHERVLRELRGCFAEVEVLSTERHGVSADLREAAAFAILGDLFLSGEPGSFPTTTGCRSAGAMGAWF